MTIRILNGDCREVMATLEANSVDAIVCDPPYDLTAGKKGGTGDASMNPNSPAGRSRISTGGGFMGMSWDATGVAFDPETWRQALRVLKPGGHLLAFSGTRTYHRMVCAIEDAGFEVRDQIGWVYGSGFPKSLDVSKAIDKAAGAEREIVGRTRTPFKVDAAAHRGNSLQGSVNGDFSKQTDEDGYRFTEHTAPATEAARQWQGWGTALKPAWEPICMARKPLGAVAVDVLARVEAELRRRGAEDIQWSEPANAAARRGRRPNLSSTPAQPAAETSAGHAAVSGTQSDALGIGSDSGLSMQRGASEAASTFASMQSVDVRNYATPSSQPTVPLADAAERPSERSSPLTTSTGAEPRIDGRSTARSTSSCEGTGFRPAIECFAGIATGLTGSQAHARINRLSDGTFEWPEGLPRYVPATGLTVAANVIAHGTGALNIDGCRVATDDALGGRWPANVIHDGSEEVIAAFPQTTSGKQSAGGHVRNSDKTRHAYGAFEGQRCEGDVLYGDSGSAARFFYSSKASSHDRNDGTYDLPQSVVSITEGHGRGAINTSKGDGTGERVNKPRGNHHPTVKPTDLMRYLCRLVTPPGGTVLDPFMGSGSTLKAAELEGFNAIGIELDPAYIEIAKRRIASDAPLFAEIVA